ncbi:COG4315 family predicted lipoprotein [Actibacterium sp. D379-3]
MKPTLLALAAALSLSATAALSATAIQTGESAAGPVLTDGNGMTLYTFDKDTPAVSNCYDDCAALWPPLEAGAKARPQGEFGIVLRSDGARQWAFKGQPLYLWVKDGAPGDITGDGVKGVWHLAKP